MKSDEYFKNLLFLAFVLFLLFLSTIAFSGCTTEPIRQYNTEDINTVQCYALQEGTTEHIRCWEMK